MKKLILLLGLIAPVLAQAQTYSISWYKVAGGGGTSAGTNGPVVYSVSGTIGQHDASSQMSGGNFALTGGFWSIISVVETPGVPNLSVSLSSGSVVVSWPDTGTYTLQQTSGLAPANWQSSGYSVSTIDGTSSITITSPTGNLFFRLKSP
jgi:hypothetical protein